MLTDFDTLSPFPRTKDGTHTLRTPLLRKRELHEVVRRPIERDDPLATARGIAWGVVMGALIWVCFLAWAFA